MDGKDNPQDVINMYQKRQKVLPFIVGGLAVLLVVVGIVILVLWFTKPGAGKIALFSSKTPTATITPTPTVVPPTLTSTETPTITMTPTITETATPSGPFEYEVKENDNCWEIAQTFGVDINVLLAINNFGGNCPITPGQKILIPAPNQELPTETLLPTDIVRGTKIEYRVKTGDTLDLIASRFNSTKETIIRENKIVDPNQLFAGQILIIPVNLVTPTLTVVPTSTPAPITPSPTGFQASPTKAATLGAATVPPTATRTP
jgi:LysM repeat protein